MLIMNLTFFRVLFLPRKRVRFSNMADVCLHEILILSETLKTELKRVTRKPKFLRLTRYRQNHFQNTVHVILKITNLNT